jgi:23S rRNA (cytidine1920-2'-O)/16S rRNA (cytidine1409-2'-O)-methyltransferase
MPKERLDSLLVEHGLAEDLKQAAALVLAGQVLSGDTLLEKPGQAMDPATPLRVRGRKAFASRAGGKLEAGLTASGIDVAGKLCLDLGASTGGFTDCLLRRGAAKVVAIERGHGQLAWALSQDPRVDSREHCDALLLQPAALEAAPAFICADLSFTSCKPFFPLIQRLLAPGGAWVVLVKPQFELGAADIEPGGVVRDQGARQRALDGAQQAAQAAGLAPQGHLDSPVAGAKGNREWLLWGGA